MDATSSSYADNPANKKRRIASQLSSNEEKNHEDTTRDESIEVITSVHADISSTVGREIKSAYRRAEERTLSLTHEVNRADGPATKKELVQEALRHALTLSYIKLDMQTEDVHTEMEKHDARGRDLMEKYELQKQGYAKIYPYDHYKNYNLLNRLGSGSSGEVWKAHDEYKNDCAIKQMEIPSSGKYILAEISHLKQSNHINIPKYVDSFLVNEKEIWLVMEYIQGMDVCDLTYYIELNPAEIAAICDGVLSALAYLHNQSIIHRDVKGENVMVNNNGHVYLTDLGLSILEGPDASTETGTIRFMAPEVHSAKSYKCNADVFSLGMTIVQMVTGHSPYYKLSENDARELILNNQRPHIPETLPRNMTDFLNLCLEWDPARRSSASELLKHDYLTTKATPEAMGRVLRHAQSYREDDECSSD